MALDLLLDPLTGDLDLTGGRVNFTNQRDLVVAQRVEARVTLIRGEWFLDLAEGVPWLDLLRQKSTDAIRRAVTDAILADPDISTASVQVERLPSRSARISGSAILTSGETVEVVAEVG